MFFPCWLLLNHTPFQIPPNFFCSGGDRFQIWRFWLSETFWAPPCRSECETAKHRKVRSHYRLFRGEHDTRSEDDLGHNIFLGGAPLLPLIFGAYFSCLSFRRILVGKLGSRRHTLGSFPNCGSSNVVLYCIAGEPLPPSPLPLYYYFSYTMRTPKGNLIPSCPLFSQIYFLHLGERDRREIIAIFYID